MTIKTKHLFIYLILFSFFIGLSTPIYGNAAANKLGDVDGDGHISSSDARLALRKSVGLENYVEGSAQYVASDVDFDGQISAADARIILRVSVGLETLPDSNDDKPKEPTIGMTSNEVLQSTWGTPQKINTTITANGKREQWVYPGYCYIYLTNNIVTEIQIHDVENNTNDEEKQPIINESLKEPEIGMTADEVLQSTWGEPLKINRTITAYAVREQRFIHHIIIFI